MASHVSQCMAKTCICDTWQAMCVTHGMPCVNMHAHHEGYKYGHGQLISDSRSFSPWEKQGGGGREKEKEEERNGRKGKEEGRKGEEKERKEEKRRGKGRKREKKRKRKRKECCAVSKPGRERTRNCATRGRFPPTLVILCLGAV